MTAPTDLFYTRSLGQYRVRAFVTHPNGRSEEIVHVCTPEENEHYNAQKYQDLDMLQKEKRQFVIDEEGTYTLEIGSRTVTRELLPGTLVTTFLERCEQ